MMNPSAYHQEEDRYAAEMTAHIRHQQGDRQAANEYCRYSREVLHTGCVLYRIITRNKPE
jgi:hypothetical protein